MPSFSSSSFKKVAQLTVLSMVSALAACGGGGGGSGQDSEKSASPAQRSVAVKGTVSKGVISNGVVSIHAIENGSSGRVLASTVTDAAGQFNATVTGYDGPIYIEVSAASSGNPTLMVCDAAAGCGTFASGSEYDSDNNQVIDFGERFAVSSDFRLTTALPSALVSTVTSVSTLTHLATEFAAQSPQGLNDVSIAVALSQVQNLFGLQSSLVALKAIDITNPTAVSNASTSELQYALLSGAIMGLTNDVAFSSTLQALTTSFQINNGQLTQRDDDALVPSYLDLAQQALATAQKLNLDTFTTVFQQLVTTLQNADLNSLTDSQASPGAGGATAEKVSAFVEDLALWQGYLSLDPNQSSFAGMVSSMGVATGEDLTHMLQALAIAGQYGPIVALPDLALGAACDSLGNYLARLSCRMLIAGKSLQDICEGALNLVIFGRSLCDILNDLTLPLGAGVYGHFALYDGQVRIYGNIESADVNVTFTRNSRNSNNYGFTVAGTVDTDTGSLDIESGTVSMVFTGGLDIRNLKLPETASGSIKVYYSQPASAENPAGMQFDGAVTLNLDLSNVRSSDTGGDYAGLDQIKLALTADGEFSSDMGDSFDGSLSISGGVDSNVLVRFETDLPDYSDRAVVTLTAAPAQLANGLVDSIRMTWGGKQYDILNFSGDYNGIRISNQDGVIMDLDLSVEDGASAGYLQLNGVRFGSVSPLNGSLLFTLADGQEIVL